MADEIDMKKAQRVYDTMIQMLDSREGWRYEKLEDQLMIKSNYQGKDFPMEFIMVVRADCEVVQFLSVLPCNMPEEKRVDGAIAVCVANYGMINGSFDYDIRDGQIVFRMTTSYHDGELGVELFDHMMLVSLSTVERYNDSFIMMAMNKMTLQEFIESERRE